MLLLSLLLLTNSLTKDASSLSQKYAYYTVNPWQRSLPWWVCARQVCNSVGMMNHHQKALSWWSSASCEVRLPRSLRNWSPSSSIGR